VPSELINLKLALKTKTSETGGVPKILIFCSCRKKNIFRDGLEFGTLTVDKCPLDYPDSTEKKLCGHSFWWNWYNTSLSTWPVSDVDTGIR